MIEQDEQSGIESLYNPTKPLCANCGSPLALADIGSSKKIKDLGGLVLCLDCGNSIPGLLWIRIGKIFLMLVFIWIFGITIVSVIEGG